MVHEQAEELLDITHYSRLFPGTYLEASFIFLMRSPGRYLKSLANVFRQTFREPESCCGHWYCFPKVYCLPGSDRTRNFDHIHSHFVWIDGIAAGVAADLLGITFTIHPHAFGLFRQKSEIGQIRTGTCRHRSSRFPNSTKTTFNGFARKLSRTNPCGLLRLGNRFATTVKSDRTKPTDRFRFFRLAE